MSLSTCSHQPGLQPLGVMHELQMMVHIQLELWSQGHRACSMGCPHLLSFLGFLRPRMRSAPFPGLRKYPSALLQFAGTKAGPCKGLAMLALSMQRSPKYLLHLLPWGSLEKSSGNSATATSRSCLRLAHSAKRHHLVIFKSSA